MVEAIEVLRQQGAVIVDPADIPSVVDPDPAHNLLSSENSSVLSYGMKRDFNTWLATLGDSAPVKTLTELREWNLAHEQAGALKYGQARLDGADAIDLEEARAEYEADRARDLRLNGGARHRRGDDRPRARRPPVSRVEWRWDLGSAGLSNRDGAVRLHRDLAGPADAGRLRPEAPPVRCELRGDGVQRAAAGSSWRTPSSRRRCAGCRLRECRKDPGQNKVANSGRRGARLSRREERADRESVSDEQRSQTGCIGGQNGNFILTRVLSIRGRVRLARLPPSCVNGRRAAT